MLPTCRNLIPTNEWKGHQKVLAGTTVSAVDDDRMLLDGLAAWFSGQPDLQMIFTCGSVDELIRGEPAPADVVLLKPAPGDGHDIRRLATAGRRVLVVGGVPAADRRRADQLGAAIRAGARGYLTRDRDLATLAAAIRRVAAGATAYPAVPDDDAGAAALTPQERELIVAYASGMTMAAAARRIGVRPSTAKTYLERIKRKYASAGRPTYTKLDLAARAREDGL